MSRTRELVRAVPPFAPLLLPSAVLWLGLMTLPGLAGEVSGAFPEQTPGYVEQLLGSDDEEIETADIATGGSGRALSARDRILGLTPTSPDANRRADKFMENRPYEVRARLYGTSGGTIGIRVDF